MRFTIPQFIEHEPKIVGPLTFKQFLYIGAAGATGFVLYFIAPRIIFLSASVVLGGIGLAFAFLKIGNIPLSTLIGHFLKYKLSPKMYLWRKKGVGKETFEENIPVKKEEPAEDKLPLRINGESRLKNIKTRIETKTK